MFRKCGFAALCLSLLLFVFAGCSKHPPGAWINDGIDEDVRENFHEMNKELFEGLKANKPKSIEKLMSKTMLDDVNRIRVIELCSLRIHKGTVALLDEFYMVHHFNKENTVPSSNHGINSYALTYQPTTREMYVAFYVIKNGYEKWLLSAVYNKLDYGWKLCELELNPYSIGGRTAPELYLLAKAQHAKGYLIDAVCTMNMFRSYSTPNAMWAYKNQKVMDEFYSKVTLEAEDTYSKTIVIKQVPTQPYIFRVFNQNISGGSFPMVYYMSKLSLQDTLGIHQELSLVRKNIGKVLPGIDKDKAYLFYSVFSEKSNAKKKFQDHLKFTQVIE